MQKLHLNISKLEIIFCSSPDLISTPDWLLHSCLVVLVIELLLVGMVRLLVDTEELGTTIKHIEPTTKRFWQGTEQEEPIDTPLGTEIALEFVHIVDKPEPSSLTTAAQPGSTPSWEHLS